MKSLLLGSLILIGFGAQAKNSERVLLSDSKTFTTEVSTTTVRCSEKGYGRQELKISLSGLDGWTLFDHSNANVGDIVEPCMTAGMCKASPTGPGFSIDDLVQNKPGIETVTVARKVTEVKIESKDENNQDICVRSLREDLVTSVRGIAFHHSRGGFDQNFPISVCQ